MKTEKLIKEYEEKISLEDQVIFNCVSQIRKIRAEKHVLKEYRYRTEPIVTDRRIAEARRQCYIQFIVDVESLND